MLRVAAALRAPQRLHTAHTQSHQAAFSRSHTKPLAKTDDPSPTPTASPLSSSASVESAELQRRLTSAELRIAQLLVVPEVAAFDKVLQALKSTEREMLTTTAEFRYTQQALTATHEALRLEVRDALLLAAEASVEASAVRAKASEILRKNIGFRSERVSEQAPLVNVRKE